MVSLGVEGGDGLVEPDDEYEFEVASSSQDSGGADLGFCLGFEMDNDMREESRSR